MPDNSFEHNLSRQMGDFNYPASDAVWQKLEINLQKRKKRRWAIIWFFSGLVLVGAGIYFMARPSNLNKEIGLVSNSVNTDISENLPANPQNYSTDKSSSEKTELILPVSKSLRKDSNPRQVVVKKDNENNRQEGSKKSTENIVVDSNIDKGVEVEEKEEAPPVLTAVPGLEKASETKRVETPVTDSVSAPESSVINKETESISVSKNNPAKEISNRNISFGIRFEAGRSANGESSIPKSNTSNMISNPTAGGPVTLSNPYTQEPSFGWSIGAWVRKPVSKRINLLTGLMYHNYRTSTPVGAQVQNPLLISNGLGDMRSYYQPGNDANYQNNYHILSVPVEVALQLNNGKKLPVSWVFGLEPGWMIGTNAVIKDTSGYLYNNKSMYNRFQLGLQTGISFRLFQKTKHALELGPVFRYMLTPAFNSGTGYNGHLNFLGLRADWIIR